MAQLFILEASVDMLICSLVCKRWWDYLRIFGWFQIIKKNMPFFLWLQYLQSENWKKKPYSWTSLTWPQLAPKMLHKPAYDQKTSTPFFHMSVVEFPFHAIGFYHTCNNFLSLLLFRSASRITIWYQIQYFNLMHTKLEFFFCFLKLWQILNSKCLSWRGICK